MFLEREKGGLREGATGREVKMQKIGKDTRLVRERKVSTRSVFFFLSCSFVLPRRAKQVVEGWELLQRDWNARPDLDWGL
jgi:hypothetical protein